MVVWKFRSCPRCGGDIFIDRDSDVWFAQCLQCSHRREVDINAKPRKNPVTTGTQQSETRVLK